MDNVEILEILNFFKINGIRQGKLDKVLRFQDILGHCTNIEIHAIWESFDTIQKSLFVWAISACLSYEMVVLIMDETVGRDSKRKVLRQFESEYEELSKREIEINDRLHTVEKREADLEKVIQANKQIQAILNNIYG